MLLAALLVLFALGYASTPKASDYLYSSVVCRYLEDKAGIKDVCSRAIQDVKNKYCDAVESFFNDDELEKYIDGMKEDFTELEEHLKAGVDDMMNFLDSIANTINDKNLKKVINATKKLILIPIDMEIDLSKVSYAIANTYNLGAICLASDPIDWFVDNTPRITKDIIDRMEDLCYDSFDMVEDYFLKIADALGEIDGSISKQMKKEIKNFFKVLKDLELCSLVSNALDFVEGTGLYDAIFAAIFGAFEELGGFVDYIECLAKNITDPSRCSMKFSVKPASVYIGRVMDDPVVHKVILASEQAKYKIDDKGYNIYKAAKSNPEYKNLVEDQFPESFNRGLEVWEIVVIVVVLVVVVGLAVGLGVWFGYAKPRKNKAKAGSKSSAPKKEEKKEKESESSSSSSTSSSSSSSSSKDTRDKTSNSE